MIFNITKTKELVFCRPNPRLQLLLDDLLAMVRRTFKRMDERSFCLSDKVYIRPHLKFSVQAWSPYLRNDIDCLERVQRAATRLVPHLRNLTYKKRLERLRLPSLFDRRRRGDIIETYKILTGKVKVN